MIFNEIYSAYYNTVAKIITSVIDGKTDDRTLNKIVCDNAFGESVLTVLPSLKGEKWQLVKRDMTTSIKHAPTMPLTLVQKQWLKAISLDPRIKLFGVELGGLDDVEPLFTPDDYYIYDKYGDGDPYDDEAYVEHFRTILTALGNEQSLKIEMLNRKGNTVYVRCMPERLEYSEKDDKFRLITRGCRFVGTVNIARITKCHLYNGDTVIDPEPYETRSETVTLKVSEERNTLERCMLHFAHFEKRAERVDDHYLLHVNFHIDDEPEMVIRVLSFGPTVEVLGPDSFKKLIINKLKSQKSCEL
ncbi:MAG: WYL domain-containing protein [Clostridia bacterium]|nr:WYL domain-containing protein [Clostridia bacterium]